MILGIIIILLAISAIVYFIVKENIKKGNSKISFKEAIDLTGLPIVTFFNGDRKLNFILDTGSNMSYINSSIISLLDHKKTGKNQETVGIEGNKINTQQCSMPVTYKNQRFEEEFDIIDLDNAFNIIKQESGVQIHGILGSKFFEKYKYVLDFKELTAYIK